MDSDGMADYVDFTTNPYVIYHSAGGAWSASGNTVIADSAGVRPDLLEMMENGIGGTTLLEYSPLDPMEQDGGDAVSDLPFNVWTVTKIIQQALANLDSADTFHEIEIQPSNVWGSLPSPLFPFRRRTTIFFSMGSIFRMTDLPQAAVSHFSRCR